MLSVVELFKDEGTRRRVGDRLGARLLWRHNEVNLVHLTTLYPGYIADFERRHPEAAGLSFADHQAALYRDAFAWSDYFVRHLKTRGHAGLHLVANYALLQGKWAREQGFTPAANQSAFSIVQAQLRAVRPDVLFVEDCFTFSAPKIRALREASANIRAVACYHGVESDPTMIVPRDALLLTCAMGLVEDWGALGFRTALLRHAFEPTVLDELPQSDGRAAVSFVGSCSPFVHPVRHEWLEAIADAVPELEVWTDSFNVRGRALARVTLASLARGRARRVWGHFTSSVSRHNRGAVYGKPMLAKLRDSLVTLNQHIGLSRPAAGNMRLFEATGAGACLVTDAKSDHAEVFTPDSEVVTYGSTAECIEKVRWLIEHPAAAREIARRGQERTLRDHTFAQRAIELEGLLLSHLHQRGKRSA